MATIDVNKGYCPQCQLWIPVTKRGALKAHNNLDGLKCTNKKARGKFKMSVQGISLKMYVGKR